ncbi:MAG: HAD hydrolase-like protein [Arcanobacterium sp.]|nr:HAD hydrolase-like protein [Arcanobacterium sp.]
MQTLLFDMDGTLVDSAPMITRAMQQTLIELSGREEPLEYFHQFVGPPLAHSFGVMGAPPERIDEYVLHYRAIYLETVLESPLFPGIKEMLQELKREGFQLGVATAKLEHIAQSVLEHHGIADLFTHVAGSYSNVGHSDKSEIVGRCLKELGLSDDKSQVQSNAIQGNKDRNQSNAIRGNVDSELLGAVTSLKSTAANSGRNWRGDVLMVGDRIFDVNGAAAHNVPTIIVAWGGAMQEELDAAEYLVNDPQEIVEIAKKRSMKEII